MKSHITNILFLLLLFNLNSQVINKLEEEEMSLYGGEMYRIKDFPSSYVAKRNIDIWVPSNYNDNKKYSVIYMHDGGALFCKQTSPGLFGSKWKVDEVATKILNQKKVKDFIIVGIYNTGMTRWNEYFPKKSYDYLNENFKDSLNILYERNRFEIDLFSDEYLKFIVKELKPFIDKEFAVYKHPEETYIAGSSMGGLISMYAAFEYPEIFSRAACISTHWLGVGRNIDGVYDKRVPLSIFDYMKDNVPNSKTHKFWFDYGDAEGDLDSYYVEYADNVNSIFNENGYDSTNFKNIRYPGEKHNGRSWNKRLDQILEFLLKP